MVNNLTNYIQPLLAQGMQALRDISVLPRIATRAYEPTPGARGSTILVPVPSPGAANDVTPGHIAPDTPAIAPTMKPIVIDQWKEAPFTLTDSDLMKVSAGIIPMAANSAIIALSNAVEANLWAKLAKAAYMNGVAGTTPFAVSSTTGMADLSVYIGARKALNKRLVPKDGRISIIDPDAAGNLLQSRNFQDAAWRGDTGGILAGAIGYKLGANWLESNWVPTEASTALSAGAATVNGVNAAGATLLSVAKATNAAPLLAGNAIVIATGPAAGIYRVTADTSLIVGNTAVPIWPALRGATAGGEAISLMATFVQNVLMHPDGFAFVTRPLGEATPAEGAGLAAFDSIVDPVSGLTLRLELTREYKQWRWSYDVMWGSELTRDEYVQIMLG